MENSWVYETQEKKSALGRENNQENPTVMV